MAPNEILIFRLNRTPTGKRGVVSTLDDQRRRVFRSQDLQTLFHQHREEWSIRSTVSWKSFLAFLQMELDLKEILLKASSHETTLRRYLWRKPTAFEVAAAMRSTAYLCHSSAVLLHGLNDQLPQRVLYVNYEQSEKPRPEGELRKSVLIALSEASRENPRMLSNTIITRSFS